MAVGDDDIPSRQETLYMFLLGNTMLPIIRAINPGDGPG